MFNKKRNQQRPSLSGILSSLMGNRNRQSQSQPQQFHSPLMEMFNQAVDSPSDNGQGFDGVRGDVDGGGDQGGGCDSYSSGDVGDGGSSSGADCGCDG